MTQDTDNTSRRAVIGSLATGTVVLAGCTSLKDLRPSSGDTNGTASPTASPTETTNGGEGTSTPQRASEPGSHKPMAKKAAGFEDLSFWTAHANVKLSADKDHVYSGTQSARVENYSGSIQREFPVPLDLTNKDISLVMDVENPTNTIVTVGLYDTGGKQTRLIQTYYGTGHPDGWVRFNPSVDTGNANLRSIKKILITIDGPGEGKKYWVDSIRFSNKTVDKAQVAFTFDYITRSIYDVAFPIMQDRGLKGCVAVPVDHVGNAGRLTRAELTELKNAGWEIASMSNSFGNLRGKKEDIQRKRLKRAKNLLKEWGLGSAPTLFPPNGAMDTTTAKLASELHMSAYLKFDNSNSGHTQSWLSNPVYVNRARPNSPDALRNQLGPATSYRSVYTIWHNVIGSDVQNSEAEFREMCDIVANRRDRGEIGVSLPKEIASKSA